MDIDFFIQEELGLAKLSIWDPLQATVYFGIQLSPSVAALV